MINWLYPRIFVLSILGLRAEFPLPSISRLKDSHESFYSQKIASESENSSRNIKFLVTVILDLERSVLVTTWDCPSSFTVKSFYIIIICIKINLFSLANVIL